ncbi:DUF4214 domain-containing protein [uncultured Mameliella sp.]|uniref:DUF4214 domain-containing protein n=1 Tax=uncultured Mameliella sp. TaxID=1447087 RepID=UPI002603F366|nr:DUF4214 domain-containing protein [uncultured Mameliella sp.]
MAAFNMSLASATATGTFVQDYHFGTNALHEINIATDGDMLPHDGFIAAVDALDLTHLRYPGGHAENTIDITRLDNGQLRAEVRAFMDWVVANSTPGHMIQVTFVLPTKVDIPAAQIEAFVYLLLQEYGDHVSGLEIGNEYSIGKRVDGFDRSTHPEDIPDSDFVSSMNETEYGIAANRVINAAQDAIDRLARDHPDLGHDPAILLQLGDISGAGSAYKGNGNWDEANEAILSWLDQRALDAIDGAVAHYYYNIQHTDSVVFEDSNQKGRSIDLRIDNFNMHLGREVPVYITEWNVLNSNTNQQGMAAASTLVEMFEFIVQADTADAFIWPLQHRTSNTIAGNRGAEDMDLSAGGGAFRMMADSLRPETSAETGHVERFESIETAWNGSSGEVEINYYASPYHDVIYVSLRDLDPGAITLDLAPFLDDATGVTVTRLTMDPASSDGLSDLADEDGLNRIGRRYIDAEELAALSQLAFFDETNKNHVQDLGGGQYRTYLPTATGIVALVTNPRDISDYYFATEVDVAPMLVDVPGDHLNSGSVGLAMLPYDVAQIVIEKKWVQEGTAANERLTGGIGQDVILGREGNDTIATGEGDDTVKGGYGDDHLDAGSGADYIVAGSGNDTVLGGAGGDLIVAGTGTKTIQGGGGQDTVRLDGASGGFTASFSNGVLRLLSADSDVRLQGVEVLDFDNRTVSVTDYLNEIGSAPGGIYGTSNDDLLTGTSGNEIISGGAGRDILLGHGGQDTLIGDEGDDLLIAEGRGLYGTEFSEQVYRIYNAVFGREPDVNGHQYWVQQLASSAMTHAEVSGHFMSSPEFQQTYGTTTDAEFVTLLYQNVLSRAPDPAGMASWLASLDGGMSRQMVVRHFAESPENKASTQVAQAEFDGRWDAASWSDDLFRLYQAMLGTEPDPAQFQDWMQALTEGATIEDVVAGLMALPVYQSGLGATSDDQFVTRLYRNLLDRSPNGAELASWTAALDGGLDRSAVILDLIDSPAAIAANDAAVTAYMLGLGPDDVLEAGTGDDVLSGGLYSDTFVFDRGDAGTHLVTDLERWDRVDLSDFGYADADAALARMSQQGDDVIFQDQGVIVVFDDQQLDQITTDMILYA